ncbi:hypothetical protein Ciccas_013753 [Cichlidogyrus casuarinus]|uniref:C2H2-type domain-containing protein n=1 Tax=Cichlidogyrus casuarinus TaxID=1844966 RepID=A0ABD2PL95_9PLAT
MCDSVFVTASSYGFDLWPSRLGICSNRLTRNAILIIVNAEAIPFLDFSKSSNCDTESIHWIAAEVDLAPEILVAINYHSGLKKLTWSSNRPENVSTEVLMKLQSLISTEDIDLMPQATSLTQQLFACTICRAQFEDQSALTKHATMRHSQLVCNLPTKAAINLLIYGPDRSLQWLRYDQNAANMTTFCLYCLTHSPHPRLGRGESYSCGYKPYRCEICNYSTTAKGNLAIHEQSDKHINNMHVSFLARSGGH